MTNEERIVRLRALFRQLVTIELEIEKLLPSEKIEIKIKNENSKDTSLGQLKTKKRMGRPPKIHQMKCDDCGMDFIWKGATIDAECISCGSIHVKKNNNEP